VSAAVTEHTPGRTRQLPPFHCPYCGDEELTPYEGDGDEGPAAWHCGACLRAFSIRLISTGVQRG
jgi:transcription elongation factor Elf1